MTGERISLLQFDKVEFYGACVLYCLATFGLVLILIPENREQLGLLEPEERFLSGLMLFGVGLLYFVGCLVFYISFKVNNKTPNMSNENKK